MSEIPKAYEPQAVEKKWYDFWLKEKCFVADPKSPKPPGRLELKNNVKPSDEMLGLASL